MILSMKKTGERQGVKSKGTIKLVSMLTICFLMVTSLNLSSPAIKVNAATDTFDGRAAELINYFGAWEGPRTDSNYSKYHSWVAEAHFAKGDTAGALSMVEYALDNPGSGSMFHYSSAMDCYLRFKSYYPQALKDKMKTKMTGYTGYNGGSTENHYLMYAVARYLAGQEWPDKAATVDMEAGRAYLDNFMNKVVKQGLLEGDAATYYSHYMSSMLELADLATNPTMKYKARMTYEWLLANAAPEWLNGEWVATSYRIYFPRGAGAINPSESSIPLWLYFGGTTPAYYVHETPPNQYPDGCMAIQAAVSTYRVPSVIENIAKDNSTTYVHKETHDVGGYNPQGWLNYRYMTPTYGVASTKTGYSSFFQEQVHEWSVKWTAPNYIYNTFYVKHPVLMEAWGDVGSTRHFPTMQYNGTLVGVAKIDAADPIQYLYGLVPKDSTYTMLEQDGWIFCKFGNSLYMGCKIIKGYTWDSEDTTYKYLKSNSTKNGVIVETAPISSYATLQAFADAVKARPIDSTGIDGTNPRLKYTNLEGKLLDITYGGAYTVDGVAYDYANWPLLSNPWMSQTRGGQYLTMNYGGVTRVYDFTNWTIDGVGVPKSDLNIYNWSGSAWNQMLGTAKRISMDNTGKPWVINVYGDVFQWDGSTWQKRRNGGTQGAVDIGCGANGTVAIVTKDVDSYGGRIYTWSGGSTWTEPNSTGRAITLDVDNDGHLWIVNKQAQVWEWQGSSWTLRRDGDAKAIGCGADGTVGVCGSTTGNSYGGQVYYWNGTTWTDTNGQANEIDVANDGSLWTINSIGEVWQRSGSTWTKRKTSGGSDIGASSSACITGY